MPQHITKHITKHITEHSTQRSLNLLASPLAFAAALSACGGAEVPLQNQPPLAVLACDGEAEVGVPFSVDGSKSTDVDGKIESHTLNLGPDTEPVDDVKGTVTPTRPGPLTIILSVTDNQGAVAEARCRVIVGGVIDDPLEPTDPDEPNNPEDPTDPTDPADPTDPDVPTDPTEPTDPTDPGSWHEAGATASARAYTVECATGWPTDWFDGTDLAEDVLGFAWWSCGHEELHAADAMNTEFLSAASTTGVLNALPAMDAAPARGGDVVIVYATRMIPPDGADSARVIVTGEDAVGVFARDFTLCEDGDDTDFCPLAVANAEWSNDITRDTRVDHEESFLVNGPVDLEVRAANYQGAMSWNITFEFFADGVLLDDAARFEVR